VKRILRILIVIALVVGALYFAGRWWTGRAAAVANMPTVVRVEPAGRDELVEIISAPGEVQAKRKLSISAKVSARIAELPFKEGDRVTKGDPSAVPPVPASMLVRLDAKDLESSLKSAEARLAAQQAQVKVEDARLSAQAAEIRASLIGLADAQREYQRQVQLLTSQDVSQQAVDQAQSKYEELKARIAAAGETLKAGEASLIVMKHNIDAAAAEVARARDEKAYTVISSTLDGTVTRVNAEVGELAMTGTMNNAGTVILEVADLSQMIVVTRVDETAIADVKKGQTATVRMQAYRDRAFTGVVDTVALAHADPSMSGGGRMSSQSESGRWFKVEIRLDPTAEQIRSGLNADVDIETRRWSKVLRVPSQAVLGRPIDELPQDVRTRPEVDATKTMIPVVYLHRDGKAVITPVAIGASDLTHTLVKLGLQEKDPVIIGPYKVLESLRHGQLVKAELVTPASRPATAPTTAPTTVPATRPTTTRSSLATNN